MADLRITLQIETQELEKLVTKANSIVALNSKTNTLPSETGKFSSVRSVSDMSTAKFDLPQGSILPPKMG